MKRRHIIGIILVVIFIVFCGMAFNQSLTPYVSFAEAREKSTTVQIKGELMNGQVFSQNNGLSIAFDLQDDEGTTAHVIYDGLKPDNMEHATSVVVIGQYNGQNFKADKILVKCPSKYQAQEITK